MKWGASALAANAVLAVLFSSAHAQQPGDFKEIRSRQDEGSLTRVVLKNGLTVLIEEHPLDPLVAVVTCVKAGYRHELQAGTSQLLERLYRYRSGAAREIRRLGASLDIVTGPGETMLISTGPAQTFNQLLAGHSDLLRAPEFDAAQVALEAELLREERARRLSQPRAVRRSALLDMLYPSDDAERRHLQAREELVSPDAARAELTGYHRRFFQPANVVVAISGNVRRERVLDRVIELYASLPGATQAAPGPPSESDFAPGQSFRYRHLRGSTPVPRALFGYRMPGRRHRDHTAATLIPYILGRGRASMLLRTGGDEEAAVLETSVKTHGSGPREELVIRVSCDPDRVDRALVSVLTQIEVLKQIGISESELNRARALALKDHWSAMQAVDDRAVLLARHEADGNFRTRDLTAQRLGKVTRGDISRVARRYLSDSNLVLLEYFPEQAEARTFTSQSMLETLRLLVKASLKSAVESASGLRTRDESAAFEPPGLRVRYLKYEPRQTSIMRGPRIFLHEEHVVPVVTVGFFFPGGRARETAASAGLTELTLRALLDTATYGTRPLEWQQLEEGGLDLHIVNEADFFGFQMSMLSSAMGPVLESVIGWLRNPEVNEASVLRQVRRLMLLGEQPAAEAAARQALAPDHPYARSRWGSSASRAHFNLEEVQSWIQAQLAGVHPLLVIRGDVEGTSFLSGAVSTLSDSSYQRREPAQVERLPAGRSRLSRTGNRTLMSFTGPAEGSRGAALLRILESSWLAADLIPSLRTPVSRAHGVELRMEQAAAGGFLFFEVLSTAAAAEQAESQLREALARLERIPLEEDLFRSGQVGAITRFHSRQQNYERYVTDWTRAIMAGHGVDYGSRFRSHVRSSRREDVTVLARRFFGDDEAGGSSTHFLKYDDVCCERDAPGLQARRRVDAGHRRGGATQKTGASRRNPPGGRGLRAISWSLVVDDGTPSTPPRSSTWPRKTLPQTSPYLWKGVLR